MPTSNFSTGLAAGDSSSIGQNPISPENENRPVLPSDSHRLSSSVTETKEVRHLGLEATSKPAEVTGKQPIADGKGSKSGSSPLKPPTFDNGLQAVVNAWPALPADVRKMIVGVVVLTSKAAQ